MRVSKLVFNFYIISSAHVALSAVSLAWVTLVEYHIPTDKSLLCFVFFATVVGYNFVKYFGMAQFHYRRLATWLKPVQVFSVLCFVAMCCFFVKLQAISQLVVFGFGLVTFLYAIPFLPKRLFRDQKQNLRSIGGLKVYIIALVWVGVTVFLPLVNNHFNISTNVLLTALQRYVFIVALMLPFEIRDLQYDSLKLATIPQKIGVKRTKIMGALLLFCFVLLDVFNSESTLTEMLATFAVAIITAIFIIGAKTGQPQYYSSFWVEGIPIVWLLLLVS
ncbi:MAG: hypothetical protein ACK5NB_01950 [Flavobacteriaceae bacterium]